VPYHSEIIHSTPETRAKILGKMENNDECCASCTQVLYECTQEIINFSISFGSMSSGLYALVKYFSMGSILLKMFVSLNIYE